VSRVIANVELRGAGKTFAEGLLVDLVAALRTTREGELVAITASHPDVGAGLERWARLTGNSIVGVSEEPDGTRWVIRHGAVREDDPQRSTGRRLWLYTNFDCNLACTYCCVRSSPRAPRRELGLSRIRRIATEARQLGVTEIFLTGGEPFVLPDIGSIIVACAEAAPTTVLTNGMLFKGSRLQTLRDLPRDRVTLQISVDSATPELHDRNRGAGTWEKAMAGIELARSLGFRVRWAATVQRQEEEQSVRSFLDESQVVSEDRVVRRTALRGFAEQGIALSRTDLMPEATITARGIYYHPVGADDDDFLVTTEIFPLAAAFDCIDRAFAHERALHAEMARIFNCA